MAGMAAVFHGTGLLAAHDAEGDRLRAGRGVDVDAGCHHGDPHAALPRLVEGGAEDDVGLRIDLVPDAVGRLDALEEGEVPAAGTVDADAQEAPARTIGLLGRRLQVSVKYGVDLT